MAAVRSGNNPAVYHDILEFSARVLVTDRIEFLNGPLRPDYF